MKSLAKSYAGALLRAAEANGNVTWARHNRQWVGRLAGCDKAAIVRRRAFGPLAWRGRIYCPRRDMILARFAAPTRGSAKAMALAILAVWHMTEDPEPQAGEPPP